MTSIDYDRLAADYARHRRADDAVVAALAEGGRVTPSSAVLEIGSGTGDYAIALAETKGVCGSEPRTPGKEAAWFGIDPSRRMLAVARSRCAEVRFMHGRAEALPLADERVDLVFAIDVVHHVADLDTLAAEAFRVLRPRGRLCLGTEDEDMLRGRLHAQYFPETVAVELERYPAVERLRRTVSEAGFVGLSEQRVESRHRVHDDVAYRGRVFSSLRLISDQAFARGLERLRRDLARGPLDAAERHLLIWAAKP